MSESANVQSIDAIRQFAGAVIQFQTEARLCLSAMETQLRQILFWLERDRPTFWKREIERCMTEVSGAKVRLHQCRMRKMGDFRPSCIEEVKALEQSKRDLEFAQKQVPTVKRWHMTASHEANEYRGRSAQLVQAVERDVPHLLAILQFTIDRLDAYSRAVAQGQPADSGKLSAIADELQVMLQNLPSISVPPVEGMAVESTSAAEDFSESRTAPDSGLDETEFSQGGLGEP